MLTDSQMAGRLTQDQMELDALTSRAISKSIGERLRQALATDTGFPDELQRLLNRMRERESHEGEARDKSS